ncbi:MAG TPA: MarR family transcriptional regulator [Bdellovibrionota bacterium]|jgi:DNA-binding MarR family transcriptional regulator|nr:MarR family transcriptional regulator [Bdellovibrionota bacterium]
MSTKSDDLKVLELWRKIRRQLNLRATHAVRPLGIGLKQAIFIKELMIQGACSATDLARLTDTDPAATGKVIETLRKKKWVSRTDDPSDRRRWKITLTAEGKTAAKQIDTTFKGVAQDFCSPLSARDREALIGLFTKISDHLQTSLDSAKEEA